MTRLRLFLASVALFWSRGMVAYHTERANAWEARIRALRGAG